MTDPHQSAALHPRPTPEHEPEQGGGKLPTGWVETTLGEVTKIVGGGTPSANDPSNFHDVDGIAWLTPADLSGYKKMYISRGKRNLSQKGYDSSSATLMPTGSVLFSSRAPIGYVAIAKNDISTNQGFKSFILPPEIFNKYLYFYLRNIKDIAEQNATGTTFKELSGSAAATLPFLFPPLPEQIRIADKLDTLLARVEAGRERLARMPALLSRLRQSILSAAVSGELTREWRGGRDAEWETVKLEEYTSKVGSGATPRGGEESYKLSGTPLIRSLNVIFFGFKRDKLAFLDDEQAKSLNNVVVKQKDVLLNITGASIGRVTVVPDDLQGGRVNQHVCIIRTTEKLDPYYLNYYLSSPSFQSFVNDENTGTTRQALTKQQVLALQVPLPPLPEQAEIVRRVELLLNRVDALERQYQAAARSFDLLTPALLQKAFRGELVPQDPNDEPASVLLERIQATRGAAGTGKRGRTPKPQAQATAAHESGAKPKRGRPRKASAEAGAKVAAIPTASSFEDAVEQLKGLGQERTQGTRQSGLFEE